MTDSQSILCRQWPDRGRAFLVAAGLLLAAAAPAHADYRLHPGDLVELSVAGTPQLGLRVPVQLDGTLTFPMIGTLVAGSQTISDIRDRIQTAFASKVLRLYAADGKEFLRTVERDDVAVSVVEYRPVVVGGDVTRPGEVTFRPDMTVRQALASAGGLLPLLAVNAPTVDVTGLRSNYVTTWLELAAQHVRVWHLKSELGETANLDYSAIPPSPVPEADLATIQDMEAAYRDASREELSRQKSFLAAAISQADEHIGVLTKQQTTEEQGAAADEAELKRANELLSKGTIMHERVTDARRGVLLSSSRVLQVRAQLMQVTRQRQDLARDLEKLDTERTMALLQQLQEATIKRASEREKLRSIEQKLQEAGVQVPRAKPSQRPPDVMVYRNSPNGGPATLRADYNTTLEPGDVLEVKMAAADTDEQASQ